MRIISSFRNAITGLGIAIMSERNLKIHIVVTILMVGAGWYLEFSNWEWCLIVICIGSVISFEVLNTSVERLVDLVSPERNELAGRIKDISAGAVLCVSIMAAIVGALVICSKIF